MANEIAVVLVFEDGSSKDAFVPLPTGAPAAALYESLAAGIDRKLGTFRITVPRTGAVVDPGSALAEYGLRAGDELHLTQASPGWWPSTSMPDADPLPPSPTPSPEPIAANAAWWQDAVAPTGTPEAPGAPDAPRAAGALTAARPEYAFGSPDADNAAARTDPRAPALVLEGTAGPVLGSVARLGSGEMFVERDAPLGGLLLEDPLISRRHARLLVAPGAIEITDLGSRNGTFVNGTRLQQPARATEGDEIRFGDSAFTVRNAEQRGTHLTYRDGELEVNRPPRVLVPAPKSTVRFEAPPQPPPKRRLPMASAAVPVVMGAGMFAFTRSPFSLMFIVMGPLMAVWSWTDDRRSGRKDHKVKVQEFRTRTDEQLRALAVAEGRSRSWRNEQLPAPGQLVSWAENHSTTLWHRRPGEPDFLLVRSGTADQPSLAGIEVGDNGAEDLRRTLLEAIAPYRIDPQVPVEVPLGENAVLGVTGTGDALRDVVRSLVLQLVVHHSPRDVALIVLAPDRNAEWEWTKWLPHTSALSRQRLVAADQGEAVAVFALIQDIVANRTSDKERRVGESSLSLPVIVLVVEPPLEISQRDVAEVLESAAAASIVILWVSPDRSMLPGQTRVVVDVDAEGVTTTFTGTGMGVGPAEADALSAEQALAAARALAPLRDVTAGGAGGSVPDRIDLLELLELEEIDTDAVRRRWASDAGALDAVLGADGNGPITIDIEEDGPHGLIGGTTGAGKSELLQSLVASLALTHPPSRLTFVLVDYKGGAAFKDCVDLPHTVGFVTDLDSHLSKRALTSLEAELRGREHTLAEHGAKDLAELRRRNPAAAPPSLLIVIDEFAFLAREIPEFVDGVVDIGQRGRSLGVHLLLATQRPSGVVGPNIQANVNLRIALRMQDKGDSSEVLGSPLAADIAPPGRGRGYLRSGPGQPKLFQAAYVGGQSGQVIEEVGPARTFHIGVAERAALEAASSEPEGASDLQRLVPFVREAAEAEGVAHQHRPWLPTLPDVVDLGPLLANADSARPVAPLGIVDEPAQQAQEPWVVDLEALPTFAIFGASGAGKTTTLRSLAAAFAHTRPLDRLWIYGLDFGSRGLTCLDALPHCGGVAGADDLDRVRQLIGLLSDVLTERMEKMAASGAAGVIEHEAVTGEVLPHVLVLLDGYAAFYAMVEPLDRGVHWEKFIRLVSDGRAAGIRMVMTADRAGALSFQIGGAIGSRLILRMASADEFNMLGIRLGDDVLLPNGRGFVDGGLEVQVAAFAGGDASAGAAAQAQAIDAHGAALAEHWRAHGVEPTVPSLQVLPTELDRANLPPPQPGRLTVPLGVEERRMEPAFVDLDEMPTFLVIGSDQSGRSTALATLAAGALAARPDLRPFLIGTRPVSFPLDMPWQDTSTSGARAAELLPGLADQVEAAFNVGEQCPLLVVMDDADELVDSPAAGAIDTLVRRARDVGTVLLVAMTPERAQRGFTAWATNLKAARHGLVLQPDPVRDDGIFGTRLPPRTGSALPPGRAYLVQRSNLTLVQVAH